MSQDIICSVIRDNVTIAQHVGPIQIDRMSPMEASLYSAPPYFVYDAYIPNTIALRQHDLLKDEANIDYVSNTNTIYMIVDEPEPFSDGHVECKVEKTRLPS